jgi:hypothetical protein
MFEKERWATAFIETSGEEERKSGLSLLVLLNRLINGQAKNADANISGLASAKGVDALLEAALQKSGYVCAGKSVIAAGTHGSEIDPLQRGIEAARAIIFIMIKRGLLKQLPILIAEIERLSAIRAGILEVKVESAAELGAQDTDALKSGLKKRFAVQAINLKIEINPELLAGYRLTIGSDMEDFSLASKLKQLGGFCKAGTSVR